MDSASEKPGSIKLLIAGLGNSLLMDDGVGVHAARALQQVPIEGATIVEIGCAVLDALHLLEAAGTVIALDAVQAGEPPGTIYELRPGRDKKTGLKGSMHELSLLEAVAMVPPEKRPDLVILGVEPQRIDYGLELSSRVKSVLPEFVETVRKTAAEILEPGH